MQQSFLDIKGYFLSFTVVAACLLLVGVLGCATSQTDATVSPSVSQGKRAAVVVGEVLTNSAPVLTAAAGAAAAVPQAMPFAPILGGLAALASALGGYLVRHYTTTKERQTP